METIRHLKDERAARDNASSAREEIAANDILQDGALAAALPKRQ